MKKAIKIIILVLFLSMFSNVVVSAQSDASYGYKQQDLLENVFMPKSYLRKLKKFKRKGERKKRKSQKQEKREKNKKGKGKE